LRIDLPTKSTALLPVPQLSSRVAILAAILSVYLIWGSTYLGVRIAVESIPPFMLTSIRALVASGLIFVVLWIRGAALPTRVQTRNAILTGGLMFAGGGGMVAFAEQWVASGLAALAVASVPIWAAIFAGLWGRWPGGREWVGLLVGLAGVALLNLEQGMQANPLGALALLIGPIMWAFGSMWSRRLSLPAGFMGTAIQLLGGGLALILLSLVTRENITVPPTTRSLLALIYLTILGTLVAFSAYMYLVRTVRPVLATSYAYVNPLIAVILGLVLVAEKITTTGIVAMVVILTGVALLAFSKERTGS